MQDLSSLQPSIVWKYFDHIRKTPRGSGNEESLREYIRQFAKNRNLSYEQDAAGNLVVRKPASKGKENCPIIILQSHLDMVCEKDPEVNFDFTKDPIQVMQKGEYLYAVGTTLGADNGIGVAVSLAALDSNEISHGPLECLFTIDEENGLTGAQDLDPKILHGRKMINLDSEERGIIYIGCAGGGSTSLSLPLKWKDAPAGLQFLEVTVKGLHGGHSGCDIHLGRGNAIELLVRMIWNHKEKYKIQLVRINGGDKHNVIPRNATATIAIRPSRFKNFKKELEQTFLKIRDEFGKIEETMELQINQINPVGKILLPKITEKLLALIRVLPHGVIAMNPDIPTFVNTSNNLARVRFGENECNILTNSRSSIMEALNAVRQKVAAAGELAGAKVTQFDAYAGWKLNLNSPLLEVVKNNYKKFFQKEPDIRSIHAGLECGVILEKIPDMDMVSIGPQIEYPHSPKERVHIESVNEFWKVLCVTLGSIS